VQARAEMHVDMQAYTGVRTLAGSSLAASAHTASVPAASAHTAWAPAKTKSSGPLIPPQLRGRKNICTEDVHDSASKKSKNT